MKRLNRILRGGLSRTAIIPFETAIAVLVLVSGITGLLRYGASDPVFHLLPHWEAVIANCMYSIAGAGMLSGIFLDQGRIEAFGLWLLSGSIIIRFILFGRYIGINQDFILTGVFDAVFLFAAFTRMRHIGKRQILVRVPEGQDLDGTL